ncbi:MAG: hypothetical protein HY847_03395 [Betaproteobacteria bacterium]|nr:hypothetical protein [Betaproteobacteria bacterium]
MRATLATVLAGIFLLTFTACSTVPLANEIPESIANAKTAEDHQRIADYFAQKAASYEAEAILHGKMPLSYKAGHPRYPKFDYASMSAHCQEIQKQLNAAAQEAKALEQAHRDMGASLK